MKTLQEVLKEKLAHSAYIADALNAGLINYTALAREWQPWLSEQAYKDVSIGAISMALRRLTDESSASVTQETKFPVRKLLIQPHLFETVFLASSNTQQIHKSIVDAKLGLDAENTFLHFSQGHKEAMIIASESLRSALKNKLEDEMIIRDMQNLSAVSLVFPEGTEKVSGVYYPFFRALAWEQISIVEVLSIWSELTFIVNDQDTEKTVAVLQKLTG